MPDIWKIKNSLVCYSKLDVAKIKFYGSEKSDKCDKDKIRER
jgi:hypothetical protein